MNGTITRSGEQTVLRLSKLKADAELGVATTEWVIVQAAALVEIYADRMIETLSLFSGVYATELGKLLADQAIDQKLGTWSGRREALSKWFDLNLGGTPSAQNFDALLALRNSLVHGDGTMTRQQARKPKSTLSDRTRMCSHLHVQVSGGRVAVRSRSGPAGCVLAINYVEHMDELIIGSFPAAMLY